MSEMIERVARAIYEDRNGTGCRPWSRHSESYKNLYRSDARAAIEAMREPTDVMGLAGGLKLEAMLYENDPEYSGIIFKDVSVCFREMIDAALK